jgi:argininosuccinate lyase
VLEGMLAMVATMEVVKEEVVKEEVETVAVDLEVEEMVVEATVKVVQAVESSGMVVGEKAGMEKVEVEKAVEVKMEVNTVMEEEVIPVMEKGLEEEGMETVGNWVTVVVEVKVQDSDV